MEECIFCDIAHGKKGELINDYGEFVAFYDIKPSAPVHVLFSSKEHIASLDGLDARHKGLIADMIFAARDMAQKEQLEGYRLSFNVGEKGGQVVFHLHLHLMGWPRG